MLKPVDACLYWAPRVLALLFALFVGLFALDVFSLGYGVWETAGALLIHLLPTWLLLIALAVAWRWERAGAFLFFGLALLYVLAFGGDFDWQSYLIMAGPPALIGLLFLADQHYRARRQART
jgi:hypothetical protein